MMGGGADSSALEDVAGIDDGDSGCDLSKRAGFRRSNDTTSWHPWMSSVKCLSEHFSILNGPSYGCCSGFRTASRQTKMCVSGWPGGFPPWRRATCTSELRLRNTGDTNRGLTEGENGLD